MSRYERFVWFLARRYYRQWNKVVSPDVMLRYIFFQHVLGINRDVPWPVHWTSHVSPWQKIEIRDNQATPGFAIGVYVNAQGGIKLGRNVVVAPHVVINSENHLPNDYAGHIKAQKPIVIGDNVWVGTHATILPEVTIGDNVTIGAGAVVSSDIPSDSVAVGVPARVIKKKEPYIGEMYRWRTRC